MRREELNRMTEEEILTVLKVVCLSGIRLEELK
jgi:intergrase/recombinase